MLAYSGSLGLLYVLPSDWVAQTVITVTEMLICYKTLKCYVSMVYRNLQWQHFILGIGMLSNNIASLLHWRGYINKWIVIIRPYRIRMCNDKLQGISPKEEKKNNICLNDNTWKPVSHRLHFHCFDWCLSSAFHAGCEEITGFETSLSS